MNLLIFMGVSSALLSIFFVVVLPSYGVFAGYGGGTWQGICSHKNVLGLSMAFLLTPIFYAKDYSRNKKFAYVGLLLFLVVMSGSRGAWFDAAGMLVFVGWLHYVRRCRAGEALLLLLITSVVLTLLTVFIVYNFAALSRALGKDPTMSGRFIIYAEVWHSILKHPWFGYGYGGFWFPGSLESQRVGISLGWTKIGYSESGILELALQLGGVGVGLVVAMICRAIVHGIRLLRSPFYTPQVGWYLTILFLGALTNIDAGWLLVSDTLDWVLIMVACLGLAQEVTNTRLPSEEGRDRGSQFRARMKFALD